MLVIWDAKEGTPKKTIFEPHENGTEALDISPDGRHILTLSREKRMKIDQQTITLWEWEKDTAEGESCCVVSC